MSPKQSFIVTGRQTIRQGDCTAIRRKVDQVIRTNLKHTLVYVAGSVCLLILTFSSCKSHSIIEKSGEWDRIYYGEYMVENCTWNVQAAKSRWKETIFCDTLTGSLGWRWDFSGEKDEPGTYIAKTYPEIIFGKKPFDNFQSTTLQLPMKLASAQYRLEYDYVANATGVYNTTTDISFTDSDNPGPANIRAKMMIWFDSQNIPFFESEDLKMAMIGGRQHEVFIDTSHVGPEGKWVFIALLPADFPSYGDLNLGDYFDYALSEGALKPEWFLSSIEIGSEISSGRGEIVFKRFIVH